MQSKKKQRPRCANVNRTQKAAKIAPQKNQGACEEFQNFRSSRLQVFYRTADSCSEYFQKTHRKKASATKSSLW